MIDKVTALWGNLPTWAKWAIVVGGAFLAQSMHDAWGEHNFVGGTAESLVATIFHYGSVVGPLALSIWLGIVVARRTERQWMGWLVGIVVCASGAFLLLGIGDAIPGVGWRLDAMSNGSCYTDWDGRSNPTVCD